MDHQELVEQTKEFVKTTLKNAEGGHDWFHTLRVYNNALLIAQYEDIDHLTVQLAALLHDIADAKFNNGDETIGPKMARDFLSKQDLPKSIIDHVVDIIKHMSFKTSFDGSAEHHFNSTELRVVQDADRLDAMGAIGIARAFNYGGFKNRPLYDPGISPVSYQNKEEYKQSKAPTINHFYEKLLTLKDRMNTRKGSQMALERHRFMESYLEQFYREWKAADHSEFNSK